MQRRPKKTRDFSFAAAPFFKCEGHVFLDSGATEARAERDALPTVTSKEA